MTHSQFIAFSAVTICALAAPLAGQSTEEMRTVKDSVFTVEQAERGESLFGTVCAECHATSEFTDKSFITSWSTATVFEFFDNIRAAMPENAPGSLLDEEYADAVAFILSENGFPPGLIPLTTVPDSLRSIMMAIPDTVSGIRPRPLGSASFLHSRRR